MSNYTWGHEIEWGDIDKTFEVPKELGAWEYCETDIVNIRPPYQYVAVDPLGKKPPVGGEINTKPTRTWAEQIDRILELHEMFVKHGDKPTTSCVNHGHIHIHVPGLDKDIDALKRLMVYIRDNQEDTVEQLYQYRDSRDMKGSKGAKQYLKYDGGRLMPDYMFDNILTSRNFAEFIFYHCAGKDGKSRGRPFRYAVNTYCMKHLRTIEFRCLRSTTKYEELVSMFSFIENFMDAALNGGPSVKQILATGRYTFPPFIFDKQEYDGWEKTKWPKSRGIKQRRFYAI